MTKFISSSYGSPLLSSYGSPLLESNSVVITNGIAISTIGNQAALVSFNVSGTLVGYLSAPTLQYAVNGGPWLSLPVGSTVSALAFSFVVSGLPASGSNTISVRDAAQITVSATSNSFVTTAAAPVISLSPPNDITAGNTLVLSGTALNYVSPPVSFDISLDNGSTWTIGPISNTGTGTNFICVIVAGVLNTAGTYQVVIRDHAQPNVVSSSVSLTITPANGMSTPADIPGLSSWWDAGNLINTRTARGLPPTSWSSPIASLADLAGSRSLTSSLPATAWPRLVGNLGGAGATYNTNASSYPVRLWPTMNPDLVWNASGVPASSGDITIYLVWTRPNLAQKINIAGAIQGYVPGTYSLIKANSVTILGVTNNGGGSDQLILFPGATPTVLTSTMEQRHTHSVIVRISSGMVDVWLDWTKLTSSPVASQLGTVSSIALALLGNGAAAGSAQCWVHEAATWARGITDAEITTLLTAASRWIRGARRGAMVICLGQSNAINQFGDSGSYEAAQTLIMYLTGLASFTFCRGYTNLSQSYWTEYGGQGIAPMSAGGASYYLQNPGSGDPSAWPPGNLLISTNAFISSLASFDQATIVGFWSFYGENDTGYTYPNKQTFKSVAQRWMSLLRSYLPASQQSPSTSTMYWCMALPFGGSPGENVHKEVVVDLSNDPTQGVAVALWQTADSNPRGSTYDPLTGAFSGGDSMHRDTLDNINFAIRIAPVISSKLISNGQSEVGAIMPSGYSQNGGPFILSATYEGTSYYPTGSVLVTVQHDAGNDLIVPLLASTGLGFVVLNGVTSLANYSAGAVISATACARVDATHLRITLASVLTYPATSCSLYYVFGPQGSANSNAGLGRGCAVTDNASSSVRTVDSAADISLSTVPNFPLRQTAYGVVLS